MQEKVLDTIDSDNLDVLIVWTPVLESDNFAAVAPASLLVPDARSTHFWDPKQDLGLAYGETVELPNERELAWDIYFVFEPGVTWKDRTPMPTAWRHQLGLDERHLRDGDGLYEDVKKLVEQIG